MNVKCCFKDEIEVGLICGYTVLIDPTTTYIILSSNGHDKDFVIKTHPTINPYFGMTDEEINSSSDEIHEMFYNYVDIAELIGHELLSLDDELSKKDIMTFYNLVRGAMYHDKYDPEKDGYNFNMWFTNKLYNLLYTREKRGDVDWSNEDTKALIVVIKLVS